MPLRQRTLETDMTINADIFRALIVMLPALLLTYQFTQREHSLLRWVGALFAHIWQFQWRLILFAVGIQWGLLEFSTTEAALFGVPIDIILGAGLLLGVLPRILFPRLPIIVLVIADSLLCLFFFPLNYSENSILWSIGLSILVIVPSQLLARWTEYDQHIYLRSLLQNIGWAILLLWLFPTIIFNLTDDSWQPLVQRHWLLNLLYFVPMILPAGLLLNALYGFARYGKGTAFPYDAPKYLVTTGVYRYLSNPMQLGIVLMMLFWGAILHSYLVMLSAPVAFILFLVFKNVCNGSCHLGLSAPEEWQHYQQSVPKWYINLRTKKDL